MPFETSAPDPIPDAGPKRKKPRRLFLYLPFVVLALLLAGYSAYWVAARARVVGAIEDTAEGLRRLGYVVEPGRVSVSGYPFRLKVSLADARVASPGGWGLAAPGLVGEAYLHAPGHWVLVAPNGLTVTRPQGGGLSVKGEALRASVAGTGAIPWRIVLQGTKLAFTPAPGARPFSLASADRLELYLRPAPTAGQGMALFRLEGGKAAPETLLHRVAADAVVTATFEARLTRPEAFQGADWGQAVRAWARAGGEARELQGSAAAGRTALKVRDGTLSVGSDGRLVGAAPLELTEAGPAFSALADGRALPPETAGTAAAVAAARAQGQTSTINLVFQAGVTTLGPVRIGPAPKVG
jgi:hypothetical protein